jgi:two-component system nitrogen regulation response regulator NtrX
MKHDILIVDDQKDIRSMLSVILRDEGYYTREAENSHQALEAIKVSRPHLVIMDIWLNDSRFDGIEILDIIKQEHPHLPVIMISGHGNIETAVSTLKKGAYDFIEKPFQTDRLLSVVARGIELFQMAEELHELRSKNDIITELHGNSSKITSLRQNIEKISKTNSRVMIQGESGSGKEVAARLIHHLSDRKNEHFVVFNCAGIDPNRFEEELFGSEKKAGTPEVVIKMGVLEKASAGTLYLDCITDMPYEVQGKLVRILQENKFFRVGGNKQIKSDVRIISSINHDLNSLIKEGKFREDLYYRLNVVPVNIPPLSQRREDIEDLTNFFISKICKEHSFSEKKLSVEALRALESYNWPGNVRQLKNVLEWVLIMNPNATTIAPTMLPIEITNTQRTIIPDQNKNFINLPLREAREEFEKKYLSFHIDRFNGNITKTANAVGMERTALHRKIKTLNLGDAENEEI